MRSRLLIGAFLLLQCVVITQDLNAQDPKALKLQFRTRTETAKNSGRYHTLTKPAEWNPKQTAIVVCDMWDKHWCPSATERVGEMAPRMNRVIKAARDQGVFIIHCPSSTLNFYKDTPQRKLALAAPKVDTKIPLKGWVNLIGDREGQLPIDDSDGGCDCGYPVKSYTAWTRQISTIEIAENDAITDSAEAFYLMKHRGITNVIVMGVHTNMCVLGRPFSIRQMVQQGQNVVLMRDMTDTMYNPKSAPFVSHFTGTDLVVAHIEKHWCPTITSSQILGGDEFRFKNDRRPHLVVLCAEQEYKTNETLPVFARKHLGHDFRVTFVHANADERNDLPGIQSVQDADVLLVSVRRRVLPESQLNFVREFVQQGKPIVGIRTASHAFSLHKSQAQPSGEFASWPEFDRDVIGGSYSGHHGRGPAVKISAADESGHEILRGVNIAKLSGRGSLYKVSPLQKSATALLTGSIADASAEPVAWTNSHSGGGRVFYTSLGHPQDFQSEDFNRLLKNALRWAAKISATKSK